MLSGKGGGGTEATIFVVIGTDPPLRAGCWCIKAGELSKTQRGVNANGEEHPPY